MTMFECRPAAAGRLAAVLAMTLAVSACGMLEPERPKIKADAGGPDKSIVVAEDATAGSGADFALNVGRRTFFRDNSAELDSVAKVTVGRQADWLVRHPNWNVKVEGFADDTGTPEQNLDLSNRRAEAVRTALAGFGVQPGRIRVQGFGRARLVRDCPDISCKSQNRRVVTNLEGE